MKPDQQRLEQQLQSLHLHAIADQYAALAADAARDSWTHIDYLARLLEAESVRRDQASLQRRIDAEYVRFRSGTDIAVIWGMLHHIFANGWEDKEFIAQRVYGMDQIRAEVAKWTPEEVERVTGIPGEQLKKVAETFAKQRPSTFIWCMGGTGRNRWHARRCG